MDDARFDAVTRALGAGASRRGVLSLLAGITGLGLVEVTAKPRKRKPSERATDTSGKQHQQHRVHSAGSRASAVCAAAGTRVCNLNQAKAGRNLSGCDYAEAGLVGVPLNGTNLSEANLRGARLIAANISGANLRDTCLSGARLTDASLKGANLGGADLSGASLCGANLRGTNLSSSQLAGTTVCCSTMLPNGKSAAPCPSGRTCCGHGCADLKIDTADCGKCGNVCARGQICCSGKCVAQRAGNLCELGEAACAPDTEDLQAAIDGTPEYGTLQLCAGSWTLIDTVLIGKSITIIGAAPPYTTTITAQAQNSQLGIQLFGIRSSARVSLQNLQLVGGFAEQGAGIFNQGDLTIADCQIGNNQGVLGSGIYNEGTLHMIRGQVSGNTTDNIYDERNPGTIGAGGLYNDEGTVLTEGTVFSGNLGGLFGDPDNDATGYGGGIYNYFGTVTLKSGTSLQNNQANYEGGGIFNEQGAVYVYGSTLSGNAAGDAAGQEGYGGGIYLDGGRLLLDANAKVSGNTARDSGEGGGVYLEDNTINRVISSVTIPKNVVTGNAPDNVACNAYARSDGWCS
ncbi:MAG: pentapeptide repeat-containing protein [Thermomicrobiales bacterium]